MMPNGLSAKMALTKKQTANEVFREIRCLFKDCFTNLSNNAFLSYSYFSNLPGTKLLTVPKVNNVFFWDDKTVLPLQRSKIYIVISKKHTLFKQLSFQSNGSTVNENLSVDTVSFVAILHKIASNIRTLISSTDSIIFER